MKKLSVFLATVALVAACADSGVDENKYANPNSVTVDVYSNAPTVNTTTMSRVSVDTEGDAWVNRWNQYDQLGGWSQESGKIVRFTQRKYAADKSTFAGEVIGDKFRLIYPYSLVSEIQGSQCVIDLSSQTGDLGSLPMINNKLLSRTQDNGDTYMQHLASATTFEIELSAVKSGMRLKEITLEGMPQMTVTIDPTKQIDEAGFYMDTPVALDDDTATKSGAATQGGVVTLTPESALAVKNGTVSFTVGVLPGTELKKDTQIKATLAMQDETGAALTPISSTIKVAEDMIFERDQITSGGLEASYNLASLEKVPATTTISDIVAKVDAGSEDSKVINDKQVVFYGVITSSSVSNNVLSKLVMIQEADDTGKLSTEPNSGMIIANSTQTALKKIAAKIEGTNGEPFGILVRVTIPAKADNSEAKISAPKNVSYRQLSYGDDNTLLMTPIMVVDMSDKAIDLTSKTDKFDQYDAMFATVKNATVTASGDYVYNDMCFIPAKTSTNKTFKMFIKKQLAHWNGLSYVSGNSGDIVGTVLSYSNDHYIMPRFMSDMTPFEAAKIPATTSISELIADVDSTGEAVAINDGAEAMFYAVVTSSLENMASDGAVMLQSADQDATVSATAKSGVKLSGLTKAQLETIVKTLPGNTDSFGAYVRITIPAKTGDDAATISKDDNGNYEISYKADNSSIIDPLRVTTMEATDVTSAVSDLSAYNGMYVKVVDATLVAEGNWSTVANNYVEAKVGETSFNLYVNTPWNQNYAADKPGTAQGTVTYTNDEYSIAPSKLSDVASFEKIAIYTPTVSELVAKVEAGSGNSVVINDDKVEFYAVITSSNIGNNVLNKFATLQEADENGVVSTAPNSGIVLTGVFGAPAKNFPNAGDLKTMAKQLDGNTSGDTFGVLVRVNIPAKASGTEAKITSPTGQSYRQIIYSDDNVPLLTPIKIVEMDNYVVDLSEIVDEIDQYDGMFAKVDNTWMTASGAWYSTAMNYIPAIAANGKTFDMFIKLNLAYWKNATNYVEGAKGKAVGTVMSNGGVCRLAPRYLTDVACFATKSTEPIPDGSGTTDPDPDDDKPTSTISNLVSKVAVGSGESVEINTDKAVEFYGVITNSSVGSNTLTRTVMLQEADAEGNVKSDEYSGIMMVGATAQNLTKLVSGVEGADGDAFGVLVKVTIPAKGADGCAATVTSPENVTYRKIMYDYTPDDPSDSDNTTLMEAIKKVDIQPVDLSANVANLNHYDGMYVVVKGATITATGAYDVTVNDMHYIPAKASDDTEFSLFIKNKMQHFKDLSYTEGYEGDAYGTVLSYNGGCYICPLTKAGVVDAFKAPTSDPVTPPATGATTTIRELYTMVTPSASTDVTKVINDNEVVFYAVITNSCLGNNSLDKVVMLQEATAEGVVSKEVNSGLVMQGCLQADLKALASGYDKNSESTGLLVKVTIPAKDAYNVSIVAPKIESYRRLLSSNPTLNKSTAFMTAIGRVNMDENAIDLTSNPADMSKYEAMYVKIDNATLTESGNWKDGTMNFVPATTEGGKTFNLFVKKNLSNWNKEYAEGKTGNVFGAVGSYQKKCGILPQTPADVDCFLPDAQ